MRNLKAIGSCNSADDQFLAVLFGTENDNIIAFSEQEWIKKIRSGLPSSAVTALANKMDVPQKVIAAWLHTTTRTIQRNMDANIPLGLDLSDRVAQLTRVYCRCRDVFKDDSKIACWLKSPNYALGNVTPASLLDTIPGMEIVLDELGRIEHGVFI
ncbi:MAG: antitoxin Xre/MbcA/ParS toxin-binding domain-containing protein [Desulfuromonadales bacterium]